MAGLHHSGLLPAGPLPHHIGHAELYPCGSGGGGVPGGLKLGGIGSALVLRSQNGGGQLRHCQNELLADRSTKKQLIMTAMHDSHNSMTICHDSCSLDDVYGPMAILRRQLDYVTLSLTRVVQI